MESFNGKIKMVSTYSVFLLLMQMYLQNLFNSEN